MLGQERYSGAHQTSRVLSVMKRCLLPLVAFGLSKNYQSTFVDGGATPYRRPWENPIRSYRLVLVVKVTYDIIHNHNQQGFTRSFDSEV